MTMTSNNGGCTIKLSVAIITLNEERNIERCVNSILSIADEVFVVDSCSTDKTRDICQKLGVRFSMNEFHDYATQKNYANEQASFDHILSLDADEALDTTLRNNILAVKKNWEHDGYRFNCLTNYCGHWVRHCGWYPDKKLRLFDRRKARWGGGELHESIVMADGSHVGQLSGNILHYSYDSITDHVRRTNYYTTLAAKAAYKRGISTTQRKIWAKPFLKFTNDYIWKHGFLDGRYGFIICCINAFSEFLKNVKIYELQKAKQID